MRRQKYYQRRQQYQAATPRPIGNKNMLNLSLWRSEVETFIQKILGFAPVCEAQRL